jgi:hypothetical protein
MVNLQSIPFRLSAFLIATYLALVLAGSVAKADYLADKMGVTSADKKAFAAVSYDIAACRNTYAHDDLSDKPVVTIAIERPRAIAYASCEQSLKRHRPSASVMKTIDYLLGRSCFLLGAVGGDAGTLPACN